MVIRAGSWRSRWASAADVASAAGAWLTPAGASPTSKPKRGAPGCSAITIDHCSASASGMAKPK